VYLSNVELYYSPQENYSGQSVKISGEEYFHIVKVMRRAVGETLFVTNGAGKIFRTQIEVIEKDFLSAEILETYEYADVNSNKYFCIPRLKNPERFEFALEKSVELGITNFIVFESKRTVAKGAKIERWTKILISAMKQSLRSYLPAITYVKSLKGIIQLDGEKIILEQNSNKQLSELVTDSSKKYYYIFGPEGGLDESELALFNEENTYKINDYRLRSETSIIKAASIAG
jgi:16S rRNA (uracil1498-N3)-methyltransferase